MCWMYGLRSTLCLTPCILDWNPFRVSALTPLTKETYFTQDSTVSQSQNSKAGSNIVHLLVTSLAVALCAVGGRHKLGWLEKKGLMGRPSYESALLALQLAFASCIVMVTSRIGQLDDEGLAGRPSIHLPESALLALQRAGGLLLENHTDDITGGTNRRQLIVQLQMSIF